MWATYTFPELFELEVYGCPIARDRSVGGLEISQIESTGIACRIPLAVIGRQDLEVTDVHASFFTIGIEVDVIVGKPPDGWRAVAISAPVVLGIERTACRQTDAELAVLDGQHQPIATVHEVGDAVDTSAKVVGRLLPFLINEA